MERELTNFGYPCKECDLAPCMCDGDIDECAKNGLPNEYPDLEKEELEL